MEYNVAGGKKEEHKIDIDLSEGVFINTYYDENANAIRLQKMDIIESESNLLSLEGYWESKEIKIHNFTKYEKINIDFKKRGDSDFEVFSSVLANNNKWTDWKKIGENGEIQQDNYTSIKFKIILYVGMVDNFSVLKINHIEKQNSQDIILSSRPSKNILTSNIGKLIVIGGSSSNIFNSSGATYFSYNTELSAAGYVGKEKKSLGSYSISASNNYKVKKWTLEGSNDTDNLRNGEWFIIDEQNIEEGIQSETFPITKNSYYKSHRIVFLKNQGNLYVDRIEFFEEEDVSIKLIHEKPLAKEKETKTEAFWELDFRDWKKISEIKIDWESENL